MTTLDETGSACRRFPNADVIVQQEEWNDALANKSTMNRTYLREHLDPITDRVRLVEGDREGDSPRHHRLAHARPHVGPAGGAIQRRGGTVVFAGDVLPTVNHVGLPFSLGLRHAAVHDMLTKKRLYQNAMAGDWRLVLDHEPGEHVVFRVREDAAHKGKFTLEPAP